MDVEMWHLLVAMRAGIGNGPEPLLEMLHAADLGHRARKPACSTAVASAAK
jgi:hypothetical protein